MKKTLFFPIFISCVWCQGMAQSFVAAGTMQYARYDHTSTLVTINSADRVLVTGGSSANYYSCELYNQSTNSWTATGSMNVPRIRHRAVKLNDGRVLVTGGLNPFTFQAEFSAEIYNPSTQTWTSVASMSVRRYWHSMVLLQDGRVLVAGGRTNPSSAPVTNTAEIYNPGNNTWIQVASMASEREYAMAALLSDGSVLMADGMTTMNTFPTQAERYIPSSNQWIAAGTISVGRYMSSISVLNNGNVLLTSGMPMGMMSPFYPNTDLYNLSGNAWIQVGNVNTARAEHQQVTLPSCYGTYIFGGYNGSLSPDELNTAESYNTITQTWTQLSVTMLARRTAHTTTVLSDNSVVLAGGRGPSGALNSAERFIPAPCGTPPTAAFTMSLNNICAGQCVNFTDQSTGNPTSWNWSFPGGTPGSSTLQNPSNICYNTAGTYTVTLTATNSFGSNSTSQTITVNALPVANAGNDVTICLNGSTTLNATGGVSYQWTPATGLSNPSIANPVASPTVTTVYAVTVTDVNGCTDADSVTVNVFNCTGISVNPGENFLNIYPNPNPGIFIMETFFASRERVYIILYNILGEKVADIENSELSGNYRKKVNVSELPPGVYFLSVKKDGNDLYKKIIIR